MFPKENTYLAALMLVFVFLLKYGVFSIKNKSSVYQAALEMFAVSSKESM